MGIHLEEQVRLGAAAAAEGFCFQIHIAVVSGAQGYDADAQAGDGIE